MSTISSGVGLVSGLDHEALITALTARDRSQIDSLKNRIAGLDSQKASFLDLSARISGMLSRIQTLSMFSAFGGAKANSSNTSILSANASAGAAPGTYQFLVRGLASTQHLISRGFESATSALSPGTLTVESAAARVDRVTNLDSLNGYSGVQRGSIRITNRSGASATIDLTDVVTINEVIDRINAAGLSVEASVSGDSLALRDTTGGSGTLRVQEVSGGRTARDLGFADGTASDGDGDGSITGRTLISLGNLAPISALNDGLGISRSVAGGDFTVSAGGNSFNVDLSSIVKTETRLSRLNHGQGVQTGVVRITARDGSVANVDLASAKTIADVKTALEGAFGGGKISVALVGGHLSISDNTVVPSGQTATTFGISDVSGHVARDLGLDGVPTDNHITGRDLLNVQSLADVAAAINEANDNQKGDERVATASIAPDGLRLQITSTDGSAVTLADGTSHALEDLGFAAGSYGAQVAGRRIVGGLNSVLLQNLRGGQGVELGVARFTSGGTTFDVDLAGAETLDQVVQRIRAAASSAGAALSVGYDRTGTRLSLSREDGGAVTATDVTGQFVQSLGFAQNGTTLRSDNLQRKYIGEATKLSTLNQGRGVSLGVIKVTDHFGISKTVDLASLKAQTIGDVITAINDLGLDVTARVNDNGDGLLLTDSGSTGNGTIKVEDQGGTTARDLNLLGTSVDGRLDGSFEFHIQISGADTLSSVASRIASQTTLADASVLNDGTSVSPYRLSITSRSSGRAGELILDSDTGDLDFSALAEARDARVLFGGAGGLLLTSSSNTFGDTVAGLSVTASAVSNDPVTVTVERDIETVVSAVKDLIDGYNQAQKRIGDLSSYNADTNERGILLGDSTLQTIQSRLNRYFSRSYSVAGTSLTRLSQIGVTFSGGQLSFDEQKFRDAYAADPAGVTAFFTDANTGVGTQLKKDLTALTDDNGPIKLRANALDSQHELLQKRSDQLNELLTAKEDRLRNEFATMETVLSQLQSQQTTLAQLSGLTSSSSSGR